MLCFTSLLHLTAARVAATMILGPDEGIENNIVEAGVQGLGALPAVFVSSGVAAGSPADTTFSGVVLDNSDVPIHAVTIRVEGTGLVTSTDLDGQFFLFDVPVGPIRLIADGSTTTRPGTWPTLAFDVVTIAGVENTLGMPIYLLPLVEGVPLAGGDDEVALTLLEVPGFELRVLPNSTHLPCGQTDACTAEQCAGGLCRTPVEVSVTQVHSDKIPMTPMDGLQPRFIITIQPAGVHFDPPAPICLPNADGLTPGEMTNMYSFDHDLGRFVVIGPGTVTEDGSVVCSDPGFGIIKGGWHCAGPTNPQGFAAPAKVTINGEENPKPICMKKDQTLTFNAVGTQQPPKDPEKPFTWTIVDPTGIQVVDDGKPNDATTKVKATTDNASGKLKVVYRCESGEPDDATVSVVTVEIEVNDTAAENDDVVQVKCIHPARRFKVPCRARVTGNPDSDVAVVTTNPDARLRFPTAATKNLTLKKNGDWSAFEISGETKSAGKNDAKLVPRIGGAGGTPCGEEDVTVFYFDEATIGVTAGGKYTLSGGRFTVVGANAADYKAEAKIKPDGLDCTVPQIKDLRIGMIQNTSADKTNTWDTPAITWNPGVAVGTTVTVSKTIRLTKTTNGTRNDSETTVAPLYDQPGKTGTLDGNSLKPPVGCTGGAAATSFDTPFLSLPASFSVDAKSGATVVGTVTYSNHINATLAADFRIWTVSFDTSASKLCALRERTWSLGVDSSAAGDQKAVPAASDSAPSTTPIEGAPFGNDEINNPANHTATGVGADTITFTR